MFTITSNNFAEIYKKLLEEIYYHPDYIVNPRGMKVKEKMDVEFVLTNPLNNLYKNKIRSPKLEYLYPELLWYFIGNNNLDFISRYSKFWEKISNGDGTVNSAYGNLLFTEQNKYEYTEWEWAYDSLRKDKYTRQAIIKFNKPHHNYSYNLDFPCTLNGIFYIRNDELHFKITMRSQDVWFGIIYDIPFFTLLQQQMLNQLLPIYPNLKLGTYKHHLYNIHIYERNFDKIKDMLEYEFEEDSIPNLNHNYDLIYTWGQPTYILKTIYDYIINDVEDTNLELLITDKLLKNIYEYSKTQIGKNR